MKPLLLSLFFVILLGCRSKNDPSDPINNVFGKYPVQYYIMDGDTILSPLGENRYGISDCHVEVTRKGTDSVLVWLRYKQGESDYYCGFGKLARIKDLNGTFQLSSSEVKAPSLYESTIKGAEFYERTVGMNVDSLMERLKLDSLKSFYVPPYREIIIKARK